MAKRNSTGSISLDEGLKLRRLYTTVGASVMALEYLIDSKDNPERLRCAAGALEILLSQLYGILDSLGVPADWRKPLRSLP